MALIVLLSGDMGSHSRAVRVVIALAIRWWPGLEGCEASQDGLREFLLGLRKPTHVLFYSVLAVLSCNFLRTTTRLGRARWR